MGISEDDENILEGKEVKEVLTLADEQLYIIPTINKRKHYLLWTHDQTQQHPQADIGGSPQGGNKQRKAKNGVDDKHHRVDGNAIRRARETCSRSGAMEDHENQSSQRRRHLMMMIDY